MFFTSANTKPGDHGTPNAHNHWLILFDHGWGPAWIITHRNNIWLRAQSHTTSHYTWTSVTTLHDDFGRESGRRFGHFFLLGSHKSHGHGSWRVCEVGRKCEHHVWAPKMHDELTSCVAEGFPKLVINCRQIYGGGIISRGQWVAISPTKWCQAHTPQRPIPCAHYEEMRTAKPTWLVFGLPSQPPEVHLLQCPWRILGHNLGQQSSVSNCNCFHCCDLPIFSLPYVEVHSTVLSKGPLHTWAKSRDRGICESPKERVSKTPSQHASKIIMSCGQGSSSVGWRRMWPGPQPDDISMDFDLCVSFTHDRIEWINGCECSVCHGLLVWC